MASLAIRARLRGSPKLRAAVRQWLRDQPERLAGALFLEGEQIMAKSKRIVPVATGALRASGNVQPPEVVGKRVRIVLGYGGAAAPYAVFVHERPATHAPPTQWKYLEQPMNEAIPGMARRIARRMEP